MTNNLAGQSIHVDLDGAWNAADIPFTTLDFRQWGPQLRYIASASRLSDFNRQLADSLPQFVLYGSGDFHHLSALWLKRVSDAARGEVVLISFDNHPDWDIRPPRWGCGGWINRALDLPAVRQAHVWGCGNFELNFPSRLFRPRSAVKQGRLVVHPWADRYKQDVHERFDCMTAQAWRHGFERFAATLRGGNVYVTVDLDCLSSDHAAANWESGLFTPDDLAWAIGDLRQRAKIIGGDVCGAYSVPDCQGLFRRFASWWDHPKLPAPAAEARRVNLAAFNTIWPALAGQA